MYMTTVKYIVLMVIWVLGCFWGFTAFNTFVIVEPFHKLWFGGPLLLTQVIVGVGMFFALMYMAINEVGFYNAEKEAKKKREQQEIVDILKR